MIPDGLPAIAAGAHQPDQGQACVMEYVALLRGEPWTDSPECTDALVGMAARVVNDRLSEERRADLLVPRVGALMVARPLEDTPGEPMFLRRVLSGVSGWIEDRVTDPVRAFRLGRMLGEVSLRPIFTGPRSTIIPERRSVLDTMTRVLGQVVNKDVAGEQGLIRDAALIDLLDVFLRAHRYTCVQMDRDNASLAVPDSGQVLVKMREIEATF